MGFVIGYIIDGLIFGFITRYVARSKGYDGGFLWGFFLGIIGLLVVGFRPNAVHNDQPEAQKPMYGGTLQKEEKPSWTCICGTKNRGGLDYCPVCHRQRKEGELKDVKCPHCGTNNSSARKECWYCHQPLATDGRSAESSQPPENEEALKQDANRSKDVELLEKLAELHAQGILTDEEFAQKKANILEKI